MRFLSGIRRGVLRKHLPSSTGASVCCLSTKFISNFCFPMAMDASKIPTCSTKIIPAPPSASNPPRVDSWIECIWVCVNPKIDNGAIRTRFPFRPFALQGPSRLGCLPSLFSNVHVASAAQSFLRSYCLVSLSILTWSPDQNEMRYSVDSK
ncbi:hypothetical protein BJX99DRAFT_220609 [Aspergillus californicus]